jgi:hypothetical protein
VELSSLRSRAKFSVTHVHAGSIGGHGVFAAHATTAFVGRDHAGRAMALLADDDLDLPVHSGHVHLPFEGLFGNLSPTLRMRSVGLRPIRPIPIGFMQSIGYLLNPSDQMSEIESKGALAAARALGIELRVLNASSENELDTAFSAVAKLDTRALVVSGEPFFDSQRERIVALSARHGVAGVYAWREYVLAGGLMSYGTDLPGSYRQAAIYAGRILKGEKPANLPVMQPTKFHLAVNLKNARALSLEVPAILLARADEVIE